MTKATELKQYSYDGRVEDGNGAVYTYRWQASTLAPSEKKARNNLMYRVKKENDIFHGERIVLPGTIKEG